jgi:hypothetical protein
MGVPCAILLTGRADMALHQAPADRDREAAARDQQRQGDRDIDEPLNRGAHAYSRLDGLAERSRRGAGCGLRGVRHQERRPDQHVTVARPSDHRTLAVRVYGGRLPAGTQAAAVSLAVRCRSGDSRALLSYRSLQNRLHCGMNGARW